MMPCTPVIAVFPHVIDTILHSSLMLHMEQSNAAAMITHHDVDGVRKIQIHCQWFHFYDAGDEVQIMMMKCDDGRTNSQRQLLWHLQKTQPLSACGQGWILHKF